MIALFVVFFGCTLTCILPVLSEISYVMVVRLRILLETPLSEFDNKSQTPNDYVESARRYTQSEVEVGFVATSWVSSVEVAYNCIENTCELERVITYIGTQPRFRFSPLRSASVSTQYTFHIAENRVNAATGRAYKFTVQYRDLWRKLALKPDDILLIAIDAESEDFIENYPSYRIDMYWNDNRDVWSISLRSLDGNMSTRMEINAFTGEVSR